MLPTIVVPVFDAYEHLAICLDAITRTTPVDTRVIVINDASTDSRVHALLHHWVQEVDASRSLITHERNRGFVASVNHGMRRADSDVVLLNSDTQVTIGWLESLANCLAADSTVATATPWSNNGEIVSIPEFCQANPPPSDPDAVAAAIACCGDPVYPDMPTAVGFCMAIPVAALRQLGPFDEATFGSGYGEENDFCQRAEKAGWRNVLCDDAYVVHHGGASFGPLDMKPDENSMQRLLAKHPGYQKKISEFIQADPLAARRQQILSCLQRSSAGMG